MLRDAARTALILICNNGQTEGHMKDMKRHKAYGWRADGDLLCEPRAAYYMGCLQKMRESHLITVIYNDHKLFTQNS